MPKKVWIRLLIALLGLAVGISYLRMSLADNFDTRNFIIGVICAGLGFVWLMRTYFTYRSLRKSDNK